MEGKLSISGASPQEFFVSLRTKFANSNSLRNVYNVKF